jgi:hypothetical protein
LEVADGLLLGNILLLPNQIQTQNKNKRWRKARRNGEEGGTRKRWGGVERREGCYNCNKVNSKSLFAKLLLKVDERQILIVASKFKKENLEIIKILFLIRRNKRRPSLIRTHSRLRFRFYTHKSCQMTTKNPPHNTKTAQKKGRRVRWEHIPYIRGLLGGRSLVSSPKAPPTLSGNPPENSAACMSAARAASLSVWGISDGASQAFAPLT